MVTQSTSYKLRAATPQPLKGECATLDTPSPATMAFVLQTFMAERQVTETCEDQTEILCSNDMVGLGGEFVSASFTAQKFLDPDTGDMVFTDQRVRREVIIDEDEVPGASNL